MLNHIILGIVQGLTEFIPVSSSGHLIIIRELLGIPLENTLSFDVLLHLATLLAIIIFFWGDIRRIFIDLKSEGPSQRSRVLIWAIILGSIPAAILGFLWGDEIESLFREPQRVAYALLGGSLLFFVADYIQTWLPGFYGKGGGVSPIKGFWIGLFQSLALISGFSRSGSAISGGMICGLSRQESIKFAFLLGIPTIAGAAFKTFLDIGFENLNEFVSLPSILGFAAAFISGLWAVRFLVRYLSSHSFKSFIIYRVILAAVILLFL